VTPSGKQNKVYWIIDHDELYLAPGTLIQDIGDEIHVQCIVDNEYFSIDKPAQEVHPTCLLGVANLLELGEFDEGSLLHTVRTRFVSNKIYTSIGSPILISINPYQKLKDVFTTNVARKYREHSLGMING
jgi:myosin heavy subunit